MQPRAQMYKVGFGGLVSLFLLQSAHTHTHTHTHTQFFSSARTCHHLRQFMPFSLELKGYLKLLLHIQHYSLRPEYRLWCMKLAKFPFKVRAAPRAVLCFIFHQYSKYVQRFLAPTLIMSILNALMWKCCQQPVLGIRLENKQDFDLELEFLQTVFHTSLKLT